MSNSERVVLALGGAGTVGSGVVTALLEKGFKVAVISRDSSRLEKLRSFVSSNKNNLTTIVGNVGTEEGAEQAKQALLKEVGKVTDVVSSLGFSWWQGGPPHTQTLKDLQWLKASPSSATTVSRNLHTNMISGHGDAAAEHLRVLEGLLPAGEGQLGLDLHLHHRGRWREAADARHRLPDGGGRQHAGVLSGPEGGVSGGSL
ncbi:uncharacterized protein si:dkey-238o13.4 isoform X3 [Oryzias melastigma]|uniref:uncharacterized protein si:dkey-238o13.4 isoform X3 n=1 Tax=Oryzias melastigma TaxID=30732 RepID=UPI000CF7F14E|nr:uncharacterized protein si:dkey-238o13.4 isoform X3 [Oryzias melastigma]